MTYDDLHLIRSFTRSEIVGAFHGNWDPDNMEVSGYRPLLLLFNHVRYAVFGESVVAHRVFLILLYSLTIALLASPLGRLGIDERTLLLGALLALCSRYSVYHYVFLTDGAHLLQGFCFAISLTSMIGWIESGGIWALAVSGGTVLGGLLIREDTLVITPILLMIGVVFAFGCRLPHARLRLLCLAGVLIVVCASAWLVRAVSVPIVPRIRWNVAGVVTSSVRALRLVGSESFDLPSRVSVRLARWLPLVLIPSLVVPRWRTGGLRALVAAVAAVLACAPALVLSRDNLLFFPVLFAGIAYACALRPLARCNLAGRFTAALLAGGVLMAELHVTREFQLVFHPYSATSLRWSGEFVYGPYFAATIPPARRQGVIERLASIGIRDERQFVEKLPHKTFNAVIDGPWRPTGEPRLFAPRLGSCAFRP